MKWLLVTTNPAPHLANTAHQGGGWNIGDVFARIGTEQVIREVDPGAEVCLLNMDDHQSVTTPREFDRCVLAGRPLFWKDCENFPEWTHILGGWPGRDPRKVFALGVGDCYALPRDEEHMRARIRELMGTKKGTGKVFGMTIRSAFDVGQEYINDYDIAGVCPASWVLLDRPEKPTRKLCNFMPDGGHYGAFSDLESKYWNRMAVYFSDQLLGRGFDFVAHSVREFELARDLGWPCSRIILADTLEPYLDAYASASHYFGNRMHGAVILAGRNARSMAVGYDSRLGMVSRAWCEARKPSQLSLESVARFAESKPGVQEQTRVTMIRGERKRAVEWMREFAA